MSGPINVWCLSVVVKTAVEEKKSLRRENRNYSKAILNIMKNVFLFQGGGPHHPDGLSEERSQSENIQTGVCSAGKQDRPTGEVGGVAACAGGVNLLL